MSAGGANVPSLELLVDRGLHGVRIDSFLAKHLRNYTSWRMMRLVRAGCVTIDHVPAEDSQRVAVGQQVRVRLVEPPDKLLAPEPIDVPVLYDDAWLVVIDKPAGLIAHPTGEIQTGTLANAMQHWIDARTPYPGLLRPGIVHRLDRQTSGVMVVALTHDAHAELSASFENSRVSKTYVALVEGKVGLDRGTIDLPIGRAPTGRHLLMSCRADARQRKPAKTQYRVLQRFANHSLVEAKPLTGRNHQIRVHLAAIGHPLVGDEFYEANGRIKPLVEDGVDTRFVPRAIETGFPLRRHALHAIALSFAHPVTGVWMTARSKLPSDFQATLEVLANGG